ncbi:hypothetical protein U9M48_041500 [Paspalum notatum var. saurae]|uniref:General transcription and DNA repair factor IIH subunit TFB5 n=1 Tax=Paspalum notatum var. saurae TaxID=547442 RepID=A0AAQ3UTA4_PASNO
MNSRPLPSSRTDAAATAFCRRHRRFPGRETADPERRTPDLAAVEGRARGTCAGQKPPPPERIFILPARDSSPAAGQPDGSFLVQSAGKMVNAIKGLFISCDVPMAQFIVNLNASMPASEKFIVHMLDPTHMFVQPHVAEMIRSKISEFRDQNSYEKPQ